MLVSSGAIATGIPYLALNGRPNDLATQQAAAAVGQNVLIYRYQDSLDRYDIVAGQVLLTAGDLENPTHRSNARRAMERLLDLRILPIVNENDTVATHEIRFGDNDRLAALVATLISADLLVLPSLASETWGLVTNEALLHGLPDVVSDRVGCAPDLVTDGSTGAVFAAESVESLAAALSRVWPLVGRADVREASRRRAADYSLMRAAAGIAHAYRRVVAPAPTLR